MTLWQRMFGGALIFTLMAPAVLADDLTYKATLRGNAAPTETGSAATGDVVIVVHTQTQTVDVSAKISGISKSALAAHLTHAPVGPMHLHLYEPNGNVSLLLPFPMSAAYADTGNGFAYVRTNYAYTDGAQILNSSVPFDAFVGAMNSGAVVFNVHTEAFKDGEISGTVTAVSPRS